jgi:hypothetical protein
MQRKAYHTLRCLQINVPMNPILDLFFLSVALPIIVIGRALRLAGDSFLTHANCLYCFSRSSSGCISISLHIFEMYNRCHAQLRVAVSRYMHPLSWRACLSTRLEAHSH